MCLSTFTVMTVCLHHFYGIEPRVCVLPKKADTSIMMPNTHLSGAIVPVSL